MLHAETRFAAIGEDRVAYQILGEGPLDLFVTLGVWSHLDVEWEEPSVARLLRRLSSFARLVRFDRRGSGLSDPRPVDDGRSLIDHWIEDLEAVLAAAGTKEFGLLAALDAGPFALSFAARHPARLKRLVLANTSACLHQAPGYPQGHPPKVLESLRALVLQSWGRDEAAAALVPSQAKNPSVLHWFAKYQRAIASPREAADNLRQLETLDARQTLALVEVPTLVIARPDSRLFAPGQARYIADHVAGAVYAELAGADVIPAWEHTDAFVEQIEEFITGSRRGGTAERALATVLFTDIVDSTRRAAKMGDAAWRALLDEHDRVIASVLERFGGRLVDSAGDGSFATFPTPGGAIDCAHAMHEALKPLKVRIRAGLHIGEVELRSDGKLGGMAVHIGARVLSEAAPGEVLISRTVRDVLIGSRYKFKDRGIKELKGVPSKWPLYAVPAR